MSARVWRGLLSPSQPYVCLSCRRQVAVIEGGRTRRHNYATQKDSNEDTKESELPQECVGEADISNPGSRSRIRDIIRGFVGGEGDSGRKNRESNDGSNQELTAGSAAEVNQVTTGSEQAIPSTDATQKKLQQSFAAQRRRDLLAMQTKDDLRALNTQTSQAPKSQEKSKLAGEPSKHNAVAKSTAISDAKPRRIRRLESRIKKQKEKESKTQAIKESTLDSALDSTSAGPKRLSEAERKAELAKAMKITLAKTKREGKVKKVKAKESGEVRKGKVGKVNAKESGVARKVDNLVARKVNNKLVARKVKNLVVRKGKVGKVNAEESGVARRVNNLVVRMLKGDSPPKRKGPASTISKTPGFNSLKDSLIGGFGKSRNKIEKTDATKLKILPIPVEQAPVPRLSYGLERVLFNPGIYQLQDHRSRVYNFDPYLQRIMPVAEFDFSSLKEYITSSRDESLMRIAKAHGKRYMGSTSSMTAVLAHFHYLLSQWRSINISMLSKAFPTPPQQNFTEMTRIPSAIFLRWKDGAYAIDADKQFDSANVLSMLGKSMEKLLTLSTDDFEKYRKSNPDQVTDEEQSAPETFHYSTMGDFLMRSQLDAHDPRLPGTGMFDLKTRAVISIRMDVTNYEHGVGYEIKSRQGEFESYEREYYDMIRAAFLKYSMQVRMGRMDGIFVAFHNVERIFGFQYISLSEMDSAIHGQWDTTVGDQEFKLSLDLLNKILDRATKKFPETSIRLHFETREASTPFMYIFAEPVTEERVAEIQSHNEAKIKEFERKMLGLTSDETVAQETEEDDSKWENIQADVRETMDMDELSVEQPNGEDVEYEDLENTPVASNGRGNSRGVGLSASGEEAREDDEATSAAAESEDDEDDELLDNEEDEAAEEHDGEKPEEITDEADEEQNLDEELLEEAEDSKERIGEEIQEASEIDGQEGLQGGASEDEAREEESTDVDQEYGQVDDQSISGADEDRAESKDLLTEGYEQERLRAGSAEHANPPIDHRSQDTSNTAPLSSEAQADFPIEADKAFLSKVTEELSQTDAAASQSPDILAMTLTIRNKVNNKFVLRPERLTAQDQWSIEYSLNEVDTETRARALYQACQARRKKKYDKMETKSDEENITGYLRRLRELSMQGRKWRASQDEEDIAKPVQILGDVIGERGMGAYNKRGSIIMAASREPPDGDINAFINFAGDPGLTRTRAIQWLKAHNNDLNNAINAFLDNPQNIPEQQNQTIWNENEFHADNAGNQGVFTIHPADTLKPGMFAEDAPSRPPSRVSQAVVDQPDRANQPINVDSGEEFVNRTLAVSREEADEMNTQETGVLDTQSKTLRPATRKHYDPTQWALTVAGAQTQEILLNPEPNLRKRYRNVPAFIKPSPTGHRLPALVTILHAIPMAREALLNRNHLLPDYGREKEWWDGTPVKVLRIVNVDSEGRHISENDIVYECQRLMAFLDETDRAYGSADVLAGLEGLSGYENDKIAKFYGTWHSATAHVAADSPLASMFESRGTKSNRSDPTFSQSEPFWSLNTLIESDIAGQGLTLYEVIDRILWEDSNDEEETYFEGVGEVITIDLANKVAEVSGLGISIPAVLYLDRYLPSATALAKDMRDRKARVKADLHNKEMARSWMMNAKTTSNGNEVDATGLLAMATAYFEQTTLYQQPSKRRMGAEEVPQDQGQTLGLSTGIAEELKALTQRISQKLQAFEKVREDARKKLDEIGQLFTKPSEDLAEPPRCKYTLRGVSTSPHTTYVLEKTKPEDEDDMLSTDAKDWQWWKLEYVSNELQPVVCAKYTEEDVLKAASTESRNALLVYASEHAVVYGSGDLPPQLHNFVRADNLNFSAELEGMSPVKPTTPTKRKADDGDDSDLETQIHRSPPYDRISNDNPNPNVDYDVNINPPAYYPSPSPPALPSRRPVPRNFGAPGSYDRTIPTDLRATRPTLDSNPMVLDQDEKDEYGQEMQERGGRSLLHQQHDCNVHRALAKHAPGISVVDEEGHED